MKKCYHRGGHDECTPGDACPHAIWFHRKVAALALDLLLAGNDPRASALLEIYKQDPIAAKAFPPKTFDPEKGFEP